MYYYNQRKAKIVGLRNFVQRRLRRSKSFMVWENLEFLWKQWEIRRSQYTNWSRRKDFLSGVNLNEITYECTRHGMKEKVIEQYTAYTLHKTKGKEISRRPNSYESLDMNWSDYDFVSIYPLSYVFCWSPSFLPKTKIIKDSWAAMSHFQ